MDYRYHQDTLFSVIKANFMGDHLSPELANAFYHNPRHYYLNRYKTAYDSTWYNLAKGDPKQHWDRIYIDEPILLVADDYLHGQSTCSQPSFMLSLTSWLNVEQGHKVLEVGSGSGWLVAMLSDLVGETGSVYGIECLTELAEQSSRNLQKAGKRNVHISHGDGAKGLSQHAPFDRIIFTAGISEIPEAIYHQLKPDGLLLAPLKMKGIGDIIFLFRKQGEKLVSERCTTGFFVSLSGQSHETAIYLADCFAGAATAIHRTYQSPFWFGGYGHQTFLARTAAFRNFLEVSQLNAVVFNLSSKGTRLSTDNFAFGLLDKAKNSLIAVKPDEIFYVGDASITTDFKTAFETWIKLGMPSAEAFTVEIYFEKMPNVDTKQGIWLQKKPKSVMRWILAT